MVQERCRKDRKISTVEVLGTDRSTQHPVQIESSCKRKPETWFRNQKKAKVNGGESFQHTMKSGKVVNVKAKVMGSPYVRRIVLKNFHMSNG